MNKTAKILSVCGATIATAVVGVSLHITNAYKEKVAQCEVAESSIGAKLGEMQAKNVAIVDRIENQRRLFRSAKMNVFAWNALEGELEYETQKLKQMQDSYEELGNGMLGEINAYRSGGSCELSEEYREGQIAAKFTPVVEAIKAYGQ